MISGLYNHLTITLRWIMRDRVLYVVFGVGFFLLLLVPVFSSFSMRQVQESALTLVLSVSSLVLTVLAILLGSSAVVRDIDQRYSIAVLPLPMTRHSFILGRFLGISLFLILTSCLFFLLTLVIVPYAAMINPPERTAVWSTIFLAIGFDCLKAILLTALAILLSCFSTSFLLPFFASIALLLAGSASQQVYDFIHGPLSSASSPLIRASGSLLYYILPNFSAFDLHLQAVYGLPILFPSLLTTLLYFLTYVAVVLLLSGFVFSRREIV